MSNSCEILNDMEYGGSYEIPAEDLIDYHYEKSGATRIRQDPIRSRMKAENNIAWIRNYNDYFQAPLQGDAVAKFDALKSLADLSDRPVSGFVKHEQPESDILKPWHANWFKKYFQLQIDDVKTDLGDERNMFLFGKECKPYSEIQPQREELSLIKFDSEGEKAWNKMKAEHDSWQFSKEEDGETLQKKYANLIRRLQPIQDEMNAITTNTPVTAGVPKKISVSKTSQSDTTCEASDLSSDSDSAPEAKPTASLKSSAPKTFNRQSQSFQVFPEGESASYDDSQSSKSFSHSSTTPSIPDLPEDDKQIKTMKQFEAEQEAKHENIVEKSLSSVHVPVPVPVTSDDDSEAPTDIDWGSSSESDDQPHKL